MFDLGFGSLLTELENRLGLFLANVCAACVAVIMFGFAIQVIVKVCEVVEALILSANPFGVALGMLLFLLTVAGILAILHMIKVNFIRNMLRQFHEDQNAKMEAHKEEMDKLKEQYMEETRQFLIQMETDKGGN